MLERLKKLRIAPIIQYIWSRTSDFFKKGDMFLLVMCCICTCFGITLVGSATKSYPSHTFVPIQVFAFILGLFLYYVLTVLDVSIIASRWKLLLGFETFLLLLLIPFGVSGDTGNSGWLRFFGIGIQPSEIVKVVFIVLMAKQISYLKEYKNLNSVLSILQLVVHFGYTFVLLMVTTKDLGSAIVFGADILETSVAMGGTVTGEHGVGVEKLNSMCTQFTTAENDQMFALKAAFDPQALLNPGKVIPTLNRCAEYGKMLVRGGQISHPDLPRF